MKILYLLFSFTTGGTERLVCDICNEMVARQHDVHLYVVNDLYDQSMLDGLDPKVQVLLQKRPAGGGGKLKTLISIANYLRKNKIDVVHCNSLDAPELLLLKPLAAPRTKVLYTVHGMHQMRNKSRLHILLRNLLCHKVIAISQCVRQDIIDAGIWGGKVVTVPNAINLEKFSQPSDKRADITAPVIGNVARIDPATKGQDILIRAIALLKPRYPGIQCLFAGGPAKGQEQKLQKLVELTGELHVDDCIRFVGPINNVPEFLAQIDIFALPSRSEGFGISLVEAMAMGLPCVASDLEGPAEVLQGGKYGLLFSAEDPQELAQKLEQVILNYRDYYSQAETVKQYVKEQFHISGMCDRLETLMK